LFAVINILTNLSFFVLEPIVCVRNVGNFGTANLSTVVHLPASFELANYSEPTEGSSPQANPHEVYTAESSFYFLMYLAIQASSHG